MQWIGTSQQRFYADFFEAKKQMESYLKHLTFTELELRRIAKKFREADEKAYGEYNPVDKIWTAFQRGSGKAAGDQLIEPLEKAGKQVLDFFGNLVDDPKGTFEDAKDGIMDFVESSVHDKKEEFKDKYEFIRGLWNDPIGTLNHEKNEAIQKMYDMRNVLSDWYIKNVEYGDTESYVESLAYGATSLAILAVGTKGAGAVGNGVRWGKDLPSMSAFRFGIRLEPAVAYGNIDYKVDTIKPLDTYSFAKTSSAVKRNSPGAVTSSFNLERSLSTQKQLMFNDGAIGVIPQEVREKLVGREFSSFDEFRKEFWKTVAESSYAKEFNSMNIKLMEKGYAPFCPSSERYGNHKTFILHHKQPIHQGGEVYDLDNLIIVSPKMHQNILDPKYHFGKKG